MFTQVCGGTSVLPGFSAGRSDEHNIAKVGWLQRNVANLARLVSSLRPRSGSDSILGDSKTVDRKDREFAAMEHSAVARQFGLRRSLVRLLFVGD